MKIRFNKSRIITLAWGLMLLLTLSTTLNSCGRYPFPEDIFDPVDRGDDGGGDNGGGERDSSGGGERDTTGSGGDERGGNGGDDGREGER